MKKLFLLLTVAMLLASCNNKNLKYDKPYFDFDSLVQAQIVKLSNAKVAVIKKTSLGKVRDSVAISPDTTQWKHELDAFQQLDVINKPLYKDAYQLEISKDTHSNLWVRTYTTKMKSPVRVVKFFYQEDFKKLKRIESSFEEKNLMYATSRKLTLTFDERQGLSLLSSYRVEGTQKMILSKSVAFTMEGKIKF